MRTLLKIVLTLCVLGLLGGMALPALLGYWQGRHRFEFRQAPVSRGEIISVVNSTGTVKPVLNVQIGAVVSGPILEVRVDFNDKVKTGQILAEVDPLLYKAQVDQAVATLASAEASLLQAQAKLAQAQRDWQRAQTLLPKKSIAETDYDTAKATYEVAVATVAACKAAIQQNQGMLQMAQTNLEYTKIRSPVDGIIIDRKVDPGQSVASQFQTPEMFKVAPDLDKRIYVQASVDEADIGRIRAAQEGGKPVMFTVDAYPADLFQGKIYQVRLNPTTTQNVVTYPVIVEAPNSQLKLLPGMTANLSFHIDKRGGVLRVPNAAIRFYPKPAQVRPEDRALLEGMAEETEEDDDRKPRANPPEPSAMARAEAGRQRSRRHVWVVEGELLRAVEIVTGLSDDKYSELVSGKLEDGQRVVTGLAPNKP